MYTFENVDAKSLTVENIYSKISEIILWRYYAGDFELGAIFRAPYRVDRNPSFSIFYSHKYNKIIAHDFARGNTWDIFSYIQMLYCIGFYPALMRINADFNLGLIPRQGAPISNVSPIQKDKLEELKKFEQNFFKHEREIQIAPRSWNLEDREYWTSYGITGLTLKKYNVHPVDRLYVDKRLVYTYKQGDPCYAYHFPKCSWREKEHIKCYFPQGKHRFLGNISNDSDIQGYDQCSVKSIDIQDLVLTKSMKDVICLREYGMEAMAIHGETQKFNPDFIRHLKSYYKNIVSLYDRDLSGFTGARYLWKTYNIPFIFIDKKYNCKDFSDLRKFKGHRAAQEFVQKIGSIFLKDKVFF